MNTLYVLYDDGCPFGRRSRDWLAAQASLVPFHPLAQQSPEASSRFPGMAALLHARELTAISDDGEVWQGPAAAVVCLHAIEEHRKLAARLAKPRLLPYATMAFEVLMANPQQTNWLLYTPEAMLEAALRHYVQTGQPMRPGLGTQAKPLALPVA